MTHPGAGRKDRPKGTQSFSHGVGDCGWWFDGEVTELKLCFFASKRRGHTRDFAQRQKFGEMTFWS